MKFLDKYRWARLFARISDAWKEFCDKPVIIEDDLPNQHDQHMFEVIDEELMEELSNHRNFPIDRGFKIYWDDDRWTADDGQSVYWLDTSNNRWLCMTGPGQNLPKNKSGDVNF